MSLREINSDALDLYAECINCQNTGLHCPGIWKDFRNGIPPRGFYFQNVPVKILIVGKNPGHPLSGESEYYVGRTGRDLLNSHRKFQEKYIPSPNSCQEPPTTFHNNLFRYLAFFLDVPEDKIFLYVARTNLLKCSTPDEQAKLRSIKVTVEECYRKYFLAELRIFQPKVILALGRDVEKFLKKKAPMHKLPVIYVKHPSYPYSWEMEEIELTKIKEQISSYL